MKGASRYGSRTYKRPRDSGYSQPQKGVTASALGFGGGDRAVATVDADGISLAAIQGLYAIVKEKDAEIADLRARLGKIEALLEKLTEEKAGATK